MRHAAILTDEQMEMMVEQASAVLADDDNADTAHRFVAAVVSDELGGADRSGVLDLLAALFKERAGDEAEELEASIRTFAASARANRLHERWR